MRNGLYRSWFKGPHSEGCSAIILLNGRVISSDPGHTYIGYYTVSGGIFVADVHAKRHTQLTLPAAMADLDHFDIHCEGPATAETALLTCTMPEAPGISVEIRMLWIGEI